MAASLRAPASAMLVVVIATREVHIGYGDEVRQISPGDPIMLPLDEATAWCLSGWAKPVLSDFGWLSDDAAA